MKSLRILIPEVAVIGLALLFTGLMIEEPPGRLVTCGTWLLLGALAAEVRQIARGRTNS